MFIVGRTVRALVGMRYEPRTRTHMHAPSASFARIAVLKNVQS